MENCPGLFAMLPLAKTRRKEYHHAIMFPFFSKTVVLLQKHVAEVCGTRIQFAFTGDPPIDPPVSWTLHHSGASGHQWENT